MEKKLRPRHPQCSMGPRCTRPATNKHGGLCINCGAWWRRIQYMNPTEFGQYLAKANDRYPRFLARTEYLNRRGRKVRPGAQARRAS